MKIKRMLPIVFSLLLTMGAVSIANAQQPSEEKKAESSAVEGKKPVNIDNFVRAESDGMFRANLKAFKAICCWKYT